MKLFIKISLLIVTFFSLISHAGAWLKISDDKSMAQLALRTYKKGNDTVKLVAMMHFGENEFYEQVNKILKNKIVIYELAGGTFEQQKKLDEVIESLGSEYALRYKLLRLISSPTSLFALRFGLAEQGAAVDYLPAAKLIHADVTGSPIFNLIDNQDKLKQFLDALVEDCVPPRIFKQHTDKNEALKAEINQALKNKESLKDIVERDIIQDKSIKNKLGNSEIRDQIIKNKLRELWNENMQPSEISVIYGADHLQEIEEFLIQNGFVTTEEEWLKVLDLTRKPLITSL